MDQSRHTSEPTATVRIAHTQTVRDGWRHETTATLTMPLTGGDDDNRLMLTLATLMADADQAARDESARRTALDQKGA